MGEHTTPGPWHWGKDWTSGKTDKYMDFRLLGPNGEEIIPLRVDHHEPIWDVDHTESWDGMTDDADRNLIAAAPDMYEALDAVVNDDHPDSRLRPDTLYKAHTALAKAKGEDQ